MPCIIPLSRGDHLPKIKLAHGHRSSDSPIAHPLFVFPKTLATFAWIRCFKCTSNKCLTLPLVFYNYTAGSPRVLTVTVAENDEVSCALKWPSVKSFIYSLASNEDWLLMRDEKNEPGSRISEHTNILGWIFSPTVYMMEIFPAFGRETWTRHLVKPQHGWGCRDWPRRHMSQGFILI